MSKMLVVGWVHILEGEVTIYYSIKIKQKLKETNVPGKNIDWHKDKSEKIIT